MCYDFSSSPYWKKIILNFLNLIISCPPGYFSAFSDYYHVSLSTNYADLEVVNIRNYNAYGKNTSFSYDLLSIMQIALNSPFAGPPEDAVITVSIDGAVHTAKIHINAPFVKAYFEKTNLSPGDTVNVIIKYEDCGIEQAYPDTTHFEVGIKEGCEFGNILTATGDTAKFFPQIVQPVRFVVYKSFDAGSDTAVVLRVGAPYMILFQGGASKISGGNIKTNRAKSTSSFTAKTVYSKGIKKAANGNYCTAGNYIYSNCYYPNAAINPLEIIYPKKDSPVDTLDSSPRMPIVTCQAWLNGYKGGTVKYEWEYWVSNNLSRDNECARVSKIMFGGNKSGTNSEIINWNVPFTQDSIKSVSIQAVSQKDCEQIISSWTYGKDVFIGGDVWVKVTAKKPDGEVIATQSCNANKIIGLNPGASAIKQYINNDKRIYAIIKKESYGGKQFAFDSNDKDIKSKVKLGTWKTGMPLYGPPNGWGLMQIDNYVSDNHSNCATDLNLWNWKSNVDVGSDIFKNCFDKATKFYKNSNHAYDDRTILYEAFLHYNGFGDKHYWEWDGDKNEWKIAEWQIDHYEGNQPVYKTVYADYVYEIFFNL